MSARLQHPLPLQPQFWRIPFWRCSVGICRDPSIDDMGFIEKVVVDLPKRLPLKPNHVSVGVCSGAVPTVLCKGSIAAGVCMLGGLSGRV